MSQQTVLNQNSYSTYRSYARIEDDLRARIANGAWKPGAMLPSQSALAKRYGVVRGTIQRALAPLVADGTLVTDSTRGTFVAVGKAGLLGTTGSATGSLSGAFIANYNGQEALTGTIGILTSESHVFPIQGSDYIDPWYLRVVQGIERTASMNGVSTLYRGLNANPAKPIEDLSGAIGDLASGSGASAIVFVALHDIDRSREVTECARTCSIPIVYVSANQAAYPVPHVYFDQHDAGYQAADHLISQGFDRITIVAPYGAAWLDARIAGAKQAAAHAGLSSYSVSTIPTELLVAPAMGGDSFRQMGLELGRSTNSLFDGTSAIIAANDATACGLIDAASELGKKIGQDFAVVGFDDTPEARSVGLTSLDPPLDALGEEAGRVVAQIARGSRSIADIRLRFHIVHRESTRRRQFV